MTFLGQLSPLEEGLGYKLLVREGGRSGKGKKIGKAPTVHYDQFGHNIGRSTVPTTHSSPGSSASD